jgi:hypothetical protein
LSRDINQIPKLAISMSYSLSTNVIGDVGTMDKANRLHIPVRVRDVVDWLPPPGAKPFLLVADLRDRGLMRLHPADKLIHRLESARKQLLIGHTDPFQALAAFGDRYRELSYYSSDRRLHCGATIASHMQSASRFPQDFYIEALGPFIDVMTLERRGERLEAMKIDLELPDE